MKNSSKLLNFNINRDLKFKVFREVKFNLDRDLFFNFDRDLSFDVNRDLGFGKRGVVFRGYVCPVCGAPVTKDALECDDCHVKFEQISTRKEKRSQKKTWDRGDRKQTPSKKSKAPKKPAAKKIQSKPLVSKQRRSTFGCPVCGKLLYVGTQKCPGCDVVFSANPKIPAKKSPPKQHQRATAPGVVYCVKCNYSIPPVDKFCRRCGASRPSGNTISWQEYQSKNKNGNLISYDEYSGKN